MRFLLILLLIVALVVLARMIRRGRASRSSDQPTPRKNAQDMVACEHCGVHLARDDALVTRAGNFRCPEHPEQ